MKNMLKFPNNNIGYLCSDMQVELGRGNKVAFKWISESMENHEYTYADLMESSNRTANILSRYGVNSSDKIMFLLPKVPNLFFFFLGALKVGANSCILFTSIGDESLKDRIIETQTHFIVTTTKFLFKLENLFNDSQYKLNIFVIDDNQKTKNRIGILDELPSAGIDFKTPPTCLDQNSHFHFTSGSTGKPKAVQHVHGSAENHLSSFLEVIQPSEDEVYWCTADPGWVTGVSYGIIAPCLYGLTQIQFSGNFNSSKWMQIIENFNVNILYSAPTVFRILMQYEDSFFSPYNLTNLKRIYCVGEPLNPVIIEWGKRIFGKEIFDTWFQTETGSIMIAMRPGLEIRYGSMGKPLSNVTAQILDDNGQVIINNQKGLLCIKKTWPSMFTTYINHPDIYQNKFLGEYYSSGDIAYKDDDGYFWFVGRNDDVINTAGHLISPFEVESALLEIPEIADAGVVGVPDDLLYEKVVAYIVLRGDIKMTSTLNLKIKLYIAQKISSTASPREIRTTTSIPKTKSGKIMRRLLKNQYLQLDFGDISTLEIENG